MEEVQHCFNLNQRLKRDQGFFLHGRLTSYVFCLISRIVSKVYLPSERDWESLKEFDFVGNSVSGVGDFMRKTQFRNSAVRVAKVTVVVVGER